VTATLSNNSVLAYIDRGGFWITDEHCNSMTLAQALEHWSPANRANWTEQTDAYGERMTRIVQFLASEARLLGWNVGSDAEGAAD